MYLYTTATATTTSTTTNNLTNTKSTSLTSHQKITSTYLTKGVPLLYNVNIMNKTTTKTTTNKSKSKNQVQENDTALNIIGTIIGMGLAAVLFFGVILPIISAPNFGAKVLFFVVFWWLYLILGLLGVKIF